MQYKYLCSLATVVSLLVPSSEASYCFYVGSNLTEDGSVMLGGTGEEVSSHWLQIFPALDHPADATIMVGVTEDAVIPGELISTPQVNHTFRYLSMEYSDYEGFPAPLTNGGLNEYGVAVRDVWAPNRDELYYMSANATPQHGLQYSDLARRVLERSRTAREGVDVIGRLIQEYGYATYGGNTHLIADKDEGWVVWEFAGGEKLWAAERLGPDEVRVLYPGYIEDFPTDFANNPDYAGSDNLVSFAVDQGWWNPNGSAPFNIFNVYGSQGEPYTSRDGGFKYMSQAALENATMAMVPVSEQDLMQRVRDPRISDDEAGYGQVVSLRAGVDPDMYRIWVAPTGSVTAPFNPWWLGVQSVPPEYGEHRYLTKDSPSTFLNPDYQFQEATYFAGRMFKQVLYYTCSAPNTFLPIVTQMLEGFENASRTDLEWVENTAMTMIENDDREAARSLLTFYSQTRAEKVMQIGRTMVDALDGYIKLTGQFRGPRGSQINDAGEGDQTPNCLVGFDPDQPADAQTSMGRLRW